MNRKEPLMSHEDRRKLIEAPIRFTESGGTSHGGVYRISDVQDEAVYTRYMRSLKRRRIAEIEGGIE